MFAPTVTPVQMVYRRYAVCELRIFHERHATVTQLPFLYFAAVAALWFAPDPLRKRGKIRGRKPWCLPSCAPAAQARTVRLPGEKLPARQKRTRSRSSCLPVTLCRERLRRISVVPVPQRTRKSSHPKVNCTPFVRQYGILSNKWGVLLCQKEYQTNDIRRNSRSW